MRISPTSRFMAERLFERLAREEQKYRNYSRRWDPARRAAQSQRMKDAHAARKLIETLTSPDKP